MRESGPREISRLLDEGHRCGVYSGAQAAWGRFIPGEPSRGGTGALETAWAGTAREHDGVPIDSRTLFDVASLTKIFTLSAALRLADRGELELDGPLNQLIPEPMDPVLGAATLTQLLAHEAGFQAWLPLFEQIPLQERGTPRAREQIIAMCLQSPGAALPGTAVLYSDIGFIVLTHLVESISGRALEEIIRDEVVRPLGLTSVHFRPLEGQGRGGLDRRPSLPTEPAIAATESCPWRAVELCGEVHDDNAWSMGGVSGHAGIFATALDVARLGLGWLQARHRGGWISRELARKATERRPLGRGLGWDLKTPHGASSAGSKFSPDAFGHLGYTGCSLWVDPVRNACGALCTNRVHFGRNNLSIRQFRPKFHDRLVGAFETDA